MFGIMYEMLLNGGFYGMYEGGVLEISSYFWS